MYYSWYNISENLGNDTFSYVWRSGTSTSNTYIITIPDGLYEIADLNTFFQSKMIENGHNLIDAPKKKRKKSRFRSF